MLMEILKDFYNEILISSIYNFKSYILKEYRDLRFEFNDKYYIKKNAKKVFSILKLKPIPIKFLHDYDNCGYHYDDKCLQFGYNFLIKSEKNWNNVFDYVKGKFRTRNEKLLFILAHETAHNLQHTRHIKWTSPRSNDRKVFNMFSSDPKKYRQLRIEVNADKIALIVCKSILK